ncbi:hypothetical protein D1007_35982 [Hordeum vulgare]|nr:hypothetical protein D1007_35982 [Hordeum vulgare]
MSQSVAEKAKFRGASEGSNITDGHIEGLRHRHMMPPVERVAVRLPDAEGLPTPRDGEVVVFKEYLFHGFGLPASDFFFQFLDSVKKWQRGFFYVKNFHDFINLPPFAIAPPIAKLN